MKIIFTSALVLFCITLFSQIPNPGFESVSSGKPNGWNQGAVYGLYPIRDTSVTHGGIHAAAIYGSIPPALNGAIVQDFVNSSLWLPATLTGFYKFYPEMGDSLIIYAEIWKQGNYATRAKTTYSLSILTGTTNVYTQFNVLINYAGYGFSSCDSAFISIYPTGNVSAFGYNWAHPNTKALVDDLAWAVPLSISEVNKVNGISLEKIGPNPTSNFTSVYYTVSDVSQTSLNVYDVTGKLVQKVIDKEFQKTGRYRADIDISLLGDGVYIIELTSNTGYSIRQKLIKN